MKQISTLISTILMILGVQGTAFAQAQPQRVKPSPPVGWTCASWGWSDANEKWVGVEAEAKTKLQAKQKSMAICKANYAGCTERAQECSVVPGDNTF